MSYLPSNLPQKPEDLAAFMARELALIAEAFSRPVNSLNLVYLHKAPVRIKAGQLVLADGTDWQPDGVNGAGLYRRNEANDTWVFVG